jgi:outer membrane receptor protein involved in Fe transport
MNRFPRIALFLVLLLTAAAAMAQVSGTTSQLSGIVTADGKPLPGVTVTATSPALQGVRTAITGEAGGYVFPALPPGQYSVSFELEGMQKVTKRTSIALASANKVDAEMKVGGLTEAITITANAPTVLETAQVGQNFKQETVEKLPIARNIRQTVLLTPGVNPNGVNNQITISGGPSYDNVFLVNGVVVNENLRGQPHNVFIEDAIQETTVMTAAISAEYGRFTGGVVSTLTKSGGNDFKGSLRDTMTNASWTDTPDFAGTTDPKSKTNQIYEGTLGGRILRDRLWFFGAGRKAKTSVAVQTFGTNLPFVNGFDEKRYEGKLTAAITQKHQIVGSYLKVKNTETNNFAGQIYDFDSIVPSRDLPNSLKAVNYSGVLTQNLLAEVTANQKKFSFIHSGGRFTDRVRGTYIQDRVTGARMNAPTFCGVCTPEERNSDGIGAKATYFLSTPALGNHSIVVGGDRFKETRIVNNHQSGSDYTITARVVQVNDKVYPRFDSTTTVFYRPIFLNSTGTDLRSDAVFLNDRWDLNTRWTFNVGVRYDKNHALDADKNVVSNDKNWSPRLSASYDVRGDGRHKITASAARYVAKITDGSNVLSTAQAAGSPASFGFTYAGPVVNPATATTLVPAADALAILFNWFDNNCAPAGKCGINATNFSSSTYPGYGSRFKGSLKSPSADELNMSYGLLIGRNGYARIDGVHREWHNFYAAEDDTPSQRLIPPNNIAADMQFTVNDDKYTKRRYNAIELQGGWQKAGLNVGGNYTWSRLWGNDVSEGAGTATIRNTPGQIYYPEFLSYAQRRPMGLLNQDRTHRAKLWASYELPTPVGVFNISALQSYDSGFHYEAIGQVDGTGRNTNFRYTGVATNPGYVLNNAGDSHNYFFSDRGAFTTEGRLATDLAINYSLPIRGSVQFFARGDVLNVFNKQVIVDPALLNTDVFTARSNGAVVFNADGTVRTYNSGLSPFNPFTDKPVECPRGASVETCASMHANYQLGPNFGKANSADAFQVADRSLAPRTYRVSVGFRF